MNLKLLLLFSLLFSSHYIFGQNSIKGVVTDEQGGALAFVNILINGDYSKGVSTDIEGGFKIDSDVEIQSLELSYVGYEKLIYKIQKEDYKKLLKLSLKSTTATLQEAIIVAGENPAHRIIRKVVANRNQNNPEKMKSFQCQTYNKMVFEWMPNEAALNEFIEEKRDTSKKNLVQARIENFNKLAKGAENQHLFLMESVSERKYLFPKRHTEKVIHNRVSGLKHPSFVALANDVQPFSFYQTHIEILDKVFLNPISPNSTQKYFFNIEDSLYQNQDTVFIISYHPRKGKNFEGLEGLLYINTNGYALQNVIAQPYDKSFIKMKIEQRYTLVDGKQWFPEQLNFVMEAVKYPHKFIGTRVSGKSFISEVKLNPSFRKKDFKTNGYTTAKDANTQQDSIWQKYRPRILTEKESRTYVFMDSLGRKKHFDTYLNLLESLASGRFPIGKVDLLLTKVLSFNDYEGTRLGVGLATNDGLSKFFELGAYGGYGFKDEAWKYGAYLELNILPVDKLGLRFDYNQDIQEPGFANFSSNTSIFTRQLYTDRMDTWENKSVRLNGKLMPAVYFDVSLSQNKWTPNYDYTFTDSDVSLEDFDFTEVGINLRFVFREKKVRFLGTETSETEYPKLFFSYRKGFNDFLDGNFSYQKMLAAVEDDFRIRNLGETSFRIEAGWTKGNLPYSRLFSGNGIGRGFQWVEIEHTFQTMDLYEFLSDRFVSFFFQHNFETHLLKIKNWKPEFSIVQNIGFGILDKPELHQEIEFNTMEKGYYEAGLRVDNLYRFNYVNLLYLGIGGGVYYRYGPYAFSDPTENLAYRFRLDFSF